MPRENLDRIERMLLLHLLEHRSQQIRFEASQWTTEFGIFRKFAKEDQADLKQSLRTLEMSSLVYRRTQYVVGYSEPKHVLSLTPSGHRKALEVQREESAALEASGGTRETATSEEGPVGPMPNGSSPDS
jgi:DNA-binding MarR family transcriptional regulator